MIIIIYIPVTIYTNTVIISDLVISVVPVLRNLLVAIVLVLVFDLDF